MRDRLTTFAWGQMLDDLLAARLTVDAIGQAMGFALSLRMIEHYRRGVQPLHWRGEGLLRLWCVTMKKTREEAPLTEASQAGKARGSAMPMHKAALKLPKWPPVEAKKRGGRKKAVPA